MPEAANHAVFLSYAREDAAAAQNLAEALRSAGIEVWFDQSELRGGDAWDAKIRDQIKACALFVPIISRHTQDRLEAYFRLEWRLAEQRTHLMAKGKAFLVPVVIDDTRAEQARVPDAFLDSQWTQLPGGAAPPGFPDRIRALLTPLSSAAAPGMASPPFAWPSLPPSSRPRRRFLPAGLALVVIAAAGSAAWWISRKAPPPPPAPAISDSAPASGPSAQARELANQAYAITAKVGFLRGDLAVAEDLSRKATDLDSTSARAWGVRAWVEASFVNRYWDRSPAREQAAQTMANRALSIDPNDCPALDAMAEILEAQGADAAAESLARRATALDPGDFRSPEMLSFALSKLGRFAEALRVLKAALQRMPDQVMLRYDLANSFRGSGDDVAALAQLKAINRVHPFASALVQEAHLEMDETGNLAEARAALNLLEQMPLGDRAEDRALYVAADGALWERKPAQVFGIVALSAKTYFDDELIASPKAWLTALADREAGHENLARAEWETAEAVLRQRLNDDPDNRSRYEAELAMTLAWLGRTDEAARLIAPVQAAALDEMTTNRAMALAKFYGAEGDARNAAASLSRTDFFQPQLRFDPWWDKIRGTPEFEAALRHARSIPSH